ncbi:MAG: POTRA domain-containing protein [Lentimicrobiaceae bacterium]
MTLRRLTLLSILISILSMPVVAQITTGEEVPDINYSLPRKYTIGGITVTGVQYLNSSVLISLSGLQVGNKIEIPGERIRSAMDKLWQQGLFEDVKIVATRVQGDQIFLDIRLMERPRLSKFNFSGIRKGEADDLRDKIKISKGDVVTDNMLTRVSNTIIKHYIGKGYFDATVKIKQIKDTTALNNVALDIDIHKGGKVKIEKVNIIGNKNVSELTLKSALKKTKEKGSYRALYTLQESFFGLFGHLFNKDLKDYKSYVQNLVDKNLKFRIFKSSKFIEKDYEEDKIALIKKYYENGYRDATLIKDSVYKSGRNAIKIDLYVYEGNKYYYRNISFVGNTKFTAAELNMLLGIRKGDIYNQDQLDASLQFNPNGIDLMSLFVDDGYLTCTIDPIETSAENDSIDLQIRIREGRQMTVNKVTVGGNTRTNDHVIIRELYSRPGQLFSRSDILRSRTSLTQLKYFDQEKIDIQTPNIDPTNGTVDVAYKVEETSSDQLELSGGWGYGRLIGTLGVSFNNFSARNFFQKGAWKPIPSGDGQKLSLRLQSYGKGYLSASASFTEPWLGGKKPNQLSVSTYVSAYNNGVASTDPSYYAYNITGLSFTFSRRLNWPDNYFNLSQSINFQHYQLNNYVLFGKQQDGLYQSYSYTIALGRYSTDAQIFPRTGSELNLSLELTPPYSLIAPKWFAAKSADDKYRMIEYNQWKMSGAFYQQIVGDLVLMARTKVGFLGKYSNDIQVTPFNRYFMGGDGMSGNSAIDGRQLIGFRGYTNESMTPDAGVTTRPLGGVIFNKSTLELRYPLSLNPSSTIFGLVFVEAGNDWSKFKDFNPFDVRRSAGIGVRVFLPMFGLLGLDWGYGFDVIPGMPDANKGQFHFSMNSSID